MNEIAQNPAPDSVSAAGLFSNRRRHLRSVFTYPVEFKIFTQNPIMLQGILRDISMGGSCLEFEDPFRRVIVKEPTETTVKLILSIPGAERIFVLAKIRWIQNIKDTSTVKIGIAFNDLPPDQAEAISNLINMKNKDHNMMWNLWEEYQG
ncbi:MAG: PilZ domain-containing protein [Thermodesulfobacteriota bacterium]